MTEGLFLILLGVIETTKTVKFVTQVTKSEFLATKPMLFATTKRMISRSSKIAATPQPTSIFTESSTSASVTMLIRKSSHEKVPLCSLLFIILKNRTINIL